MKAVLVIFLFGAAIQLASCQCLRSLPVSPYVDSSVATSLADTLSLLTVSSLLSEKLPLGYPMVAPVAPLPAIAPIAPIAPVVGNLGCGCDPIYSYPYNSYLI
ncbi:unnamed protein product [Danaus chrysippus]|uniref:(African queen) hypothetical protein n=1 Tax=Danaus chrysippus TaxID=151541 RepID=A0A8J2QXP0_9NEOP|nr:unnamed protein product [Danaus chrysippus]